MTHGTFLVRKKGCPSVYLQTSHDGHSDELVEVLKDLPRQCAIRGWRADVLAKGPSNREEIVDYLRSMTAIELDADPATFANLFVQAQPYFDCWQIIPKEYIKQLASYDRRADFFVDLGDGDFCIRSNFSEPSYQRDKINEKVQWFDLYVDALVNRVKQIKKRKRHAS